MLAPYCFSSKRASGGRLRACAADKIAFELPGGPKANLAPDKIDAGVRQLMGGAECRTCAIFVNHRGALMRLAEVLLDKGTLSDGQVSVILVRGME